MVSMPTKIEGREYLTIAEAVDYMGCTDGWVRHLLRSKKLRGRMLGKRLWLIETHSATEQREALTTRANAKKHLAKRPAAKRKKAARRK
jgi:excisionase family DNA binding protein